jgi:deoxyribonuclease V
MWPTDEQRLVAVQRDIAAATPPPWLPQATGTRVAGCWVTFQRGLTGPGAAGDPAWVAAVTLVDGRVVDRHTSTGVAGARYVPGLLALRIGPLLEQAVRDLPERPDVLLVDAGGRDHPRRAGLAMHLGHELDLPTLGVTHRPLVGRGDWPADERGASSPVAVDGEPVAAWVRTRPGTRPLVVHPGWRVDLGTALDLVLACTGRRRTPDPLRQARRLAREARAGAANSEAAPPDRRGRLSVL